ncbi:hypothetical protein OSH08_20460 [Kaistia geumhonensis]|uniref:Hemerythrin-like domain-containing protein n=1 Tax=Kaistia geumhonensis TaxID=410839 RepID=A0ABU0MBV3_9HYPH|nr:hypothetical protein [Kaistia geumhonensis]MCX5481385.1 hypothetical protein [Kaistia geumhonensis]MDQ0518450.1 hypothetical protein [Kaistia geumhonensis]
MNAITPIYVDESRYNLYTMPHKALRRAQMQLSIRLGAIDGDNDEAVRLLVGDMRALIAAGRGHLHHENLHIHEVIEQIRAGATEQLADDHEHHERDFDELERMLDAIEAAPSGERAGLLRALYLRYSLFIAADLQHMVEEETETLALLHGLFGDDELRAIENRIIASIDAETMMGFLRLMVPAMNHGERLELVGGMRAGMPAAVFEGVFNGVVRPSLDEAEFRRLAADLGVAA